MTFCTYILYKRIDKVFFDNFTYIIYLIRPTVHIYFFKYIIATTNYYFILSRFRFYIISIADTYIEYRLFNWRKIFIEFNTIKLLHPLKFK